MTDTDAGASTYSGDTGAGTDSGEADTGASDHSLTDAPTAEDYARFVDAWRDTGDDDGAEDADGDGADDGGDDGADGADDGAEEVGDDDRPGVPRAGREAQKLRGRLREAVAERDAMSARLEAAQRGRIEDLAAAARVKPQALWGSGLQVSDMQNEDGDVDPELVAAGIEHARRTLGLARLPAPDRSQGSGGNNGPPASAASWQKLLQGGGK